MKWSGFLHVVTVLAGILSIAAMITGIILGERPLGTMTGNQIREYATYLIYLAIWLALGRLVHLSKEDSE